MKLAFSTNAFRKYSASGAVAAIAEAGYEGVELMADTPHAWPPDTTDREIRAIKAALKQHNLAVSNINAFMMCAIGDFWHPSWIERDEEKRRQRIDHTAQCIRIAASLGTGTISTEPGGPLDGTSESEGLDIFEKGLRELIPLAAQTGVNILIEPEPQLMIENAAQAEAFLKRMDSPHIGLNFDIGHFYCVGEDPAEAFRRLAPYVKHIHLEDIAADRKHYHLLPGAGAIDFAEFFKATREAGYDGWMTVELYTYEKDPENAARQALQCLQSF